MIVVSLLLILVAVMLLVLGLAGGSSMLLISSIGASLLAAVTLVIGARQTAAVRRAATARAEPAPPGPASAGPGPDLARPGPVRAAPVGPLAADVDDRPTVVSSPAAAEADFMAPGELPEGDQPEGDLPLGERPLGDRPLGDRTDSDPLQDDPSAFADDPPPQDEGLASMGPAEARGANRDDAEAALAADAVYREQNPDHFDSVVGLDPVEPDVFESDPGQPAPPVEEAVLADGPLPVADAARSDAARSDAARFDAPPLGDPDGDDPPDEPPPQAIRPADAVRVAQMSVEVLVVDGRPRYHLAQCPHLNGRLTEPLPVAEAVELGFTPCGLCRPVDRLVARAAQR
jgi:hypothetical protein